MGRLFWKFFFFIWLAQLTTIAAVSTTFWLEHRAQEERLAQLGRNPPPSPELRPDGRPFPPGRFLRPGGPPRPGFPFVPVVPLVATLLASLIFAALLAWYFSKPIRNLRSAFEAVVNGDLAVRLGPVMGKRSDELADLGRNFDRMASHLSTLIDGQRRLLHDVSHELRSPLARLQAAIGLARQQPEKLESSLGRIERESERMDKLVGELLTLSRLEAGVMGAMDETISMDELVSDVVADARFEAEYIGRTVQYSGRGEALVKGNAELLHRALENVVRNALRHTPEGGMVALEVHLDASGNDVRFAVLDQGPGVPEKELNAIFEPFMRGESSQYNDGHGLGLAIARRVVEAHGGRIRAANRAGGGLCVEIVLPATCG
ncbi:hypothetical protein SKTS_15520 [Sulfurimicrobium lacus]|uniref:histidine kinase n=1 Tax=Sulfurimicrobium lacus TaxID=2715678 RepID=A0A6F8VCC7_9PROT|nr:ATP-binding protein [Sulfurimicrobium lacus]BCB26666.1 hypothetical protein SKTS_15520 [Sulfurimicrobium lacus]